MPEGFGGMLGGLFNSRSELLFFFLLLVVLFMPYGFGGGY